jgi:hypothetical protein
LSFVVLFQLDIPFWYPNREWTQCPFESWYKKYMISNMNNNEDLGHYITNFMGHDLAIIVMQNLFSISSYGIDTNVIHLLALFEHQCHVHCLNINVICVFVLFKHKCCMSIRVVHKWKLCAWLLCLNNAWHLCLNNTNPWYNRLHTDLKWTHEAYKFVM